MKNLSSTWPARTDSRMDSLAAVAILSSTQTLSEILQEIAGPDGPEPRPFPELYEFRLAVQSPGPKDHQKQDEETVKKRQ